MSETESPKGKLLVAEDEPDLRDLIIEQIESFGYSCLAAADGQEALFQIETANIQAVICDISMPKMNGVELLQKIRSRGNSIPFVFMTGHMSVDFLSSALKLGAYNFLMKPYTADELKSAVTQIWDVAERSRKVQDCILKLKLDHPELRPEIETIEKNRSEIEMLRVFGGK